MLCYLHFDFVLILIYLYGVPTFETMSELMSSRRLEEREKEQLSLVGRLEEQLRERSEEAAALLTPDEARRLEEERRTLTELREELLRAKEARIDGEEESGEEARRSAQARYEHFKQMQVEELGLLEESLIQQKDRLEREVANERTSLGLLLHTYKDKQRQVKLDVFQKHTETRYITL